MSQPTPATLPVTRLPGSLTLVLPAFNEEANIEAVKALATGPFLRQYTRASNDLVKLTRRAQATQRSPDGVVTATVAPNGSLRHIEFSAAAEDWSTSTTRWTAAKPGSS